MTLKTFFVFGIFLHIIPEPEDLLSYGEEMRNVDEKRCYSVAEVSEILQISRQAVYTLLSKGEIHALKAGGKYIISRKSFDRWLDGADDKS